MPTTASCPSHNSFPFRASSPTDTAECLRYVPDAHASATYRRISIGPMSHSPSLKFPGLVMLRYILIRKRRKHELATSYAWDGLNQPCTADSELGMEYYEYQTQVSSSVISRNA